MNRIIKVRASADEQARLVKRAARAGMSVSNYIRAQLKLTPFTRGGARDGAGKRKTPPAEK